MRFLLGMLLMFLLCQCVGAEEFKADEEVTMVTVQVVWFDSFNALNREVKARLGKGYKTVYGISFCQRNIDDDYAACELLVVRPKKVNDDYVLILGHELLHGLYGEYHK